MKRILYIHHGESKGGAPRSLAFLIDQLDKSKYEPYVLVHCDREENEKLFRSVGARVIYCKAFGPWHGSTVAKVTVKRLISNLKYVIPTCRNTVSIIKRIKPDVIHLNSTCLCFAAQAAKREFPEIPIICHVREPLLQNFWGDILRKRVNKYVDEFVAIEKYDADSLYTKKPVTVIHNFVDFDVYNDSVVSNCLREELGIRDNEKIILYLARICAQNGAAEMAEAIEPLLAKRKDFHLVVVGLVDGYTTPYEKRLKQVVLRKPENMHVLPFRTDVPQVIASSDVMVVPFQEPHFARSVIEANAIGVPCIASKICGLDELVVDRETGFLFDYLSFNGFNELCESLLDNDVEYKRIRQNAIGFAYENFDAVKNARRTFELYDKVLNANKK